MKKTGSAKRITAETEVDVKLTLFEEDNCNIKTGICFFDHMLSLFSAHGSIGLFIDAKGDLCVDGHHTVEDVGIVLGKALCDALKDKRGLKRYGFSYVPMDEALAFVCIDLSGRPFLKANIPPLAPMAGDFDTELLEEFLRAFSTNAGITLHADICYGKNTHHMIEALFKALGRALKEAASEDAITKGIPSTKKTL